MAVVVGIDPQTKLFAVHIRQGQETVAWFRVFLKKKSRFDNAQAWQQYIWQESINLLDMVQQRLVHYLQSKDPPALVVIEQQKGRLQSIIEQCLLVACMVRKWPAKIMHSMTWKKRTGIKCKKSNRLNKEESEKMVLPILIDWSKKQPDRSITFGLPETRTDEGRLHDLCEAFLLSKAGLVDI